MTKATIVNKHSFATTNVLALAVVMIFWMFPRSDGMHYVVHHGQIVVSMIFKFIVYLISN